MQELTIEEINRKLIIWNRLANEKEIMAVAEGLVTDVIKQLKELKTNMMNK